MTNKEWIETIKTKHNPEFGVSYDVMGHHFDVFFSDNEKYVYWLYNDQCARWEYDWIYRTEVVDELITTTHVEKDNNLARTASIAAVGAMLGFFVYSDQTTTKTTRMDHHNYTLKIYFAGAPIPFVEMPFYTQTEGLQKVWAKFESIAKTPTVGVTTVLPKSSAVSSVTKPQPNRNTQKDTSNDDEKIGLSCAILSICFILFLLFIILLIVS